MTKTINQIDKTILFFLRKSSALGRYFVSLYRHKSINYVSPNE